MFHLLALLLIPSAHASDWEEAKPIRMAKVHGTITKLTIDRRDGSNDIIAAPVCQFDGAVPVYDISDDEKVTKKAIVASCASSVGEKIVKAVIAGSLVIENWTGTGVLKGANFDLYAVGDTLKGTPLPQPITGFAGTRDLKARSLFLYLDNSAWNGADGVPISEEKFSAMIEVIDDSF